MSYQLDDKECTEDREVDGPCKDGCETMGPPDPSLPIVMMEKEVAAMMRWGRRGREGGDRPSVAPD